MKYGFYMAILTGLIGQGGPPAGAQVEALPNPSFEEGTTAPTGWSLSGGTGRWEEPGHTGRRCVSITGTGEDSHFWRCDGYTFAPGQLYRLSFWTKTSPGAGGGTITSGPDVVNRDFDAGPAWTRRSFVFRIPDSSREAFLRFGQWRKKGTVFFDDIELIPVTPVYSRQGQVELGAGESIRRGAYRFQSQYGGEGSNQARPLVSHTASFNSNRWVMGQGSEVIYRHAVGRWSQQQGRITVEIGWYEGGKCLVEASRTGADWQPVGELAGVKTEAFEVPAGLYPTPALWVRLRGAEARDGEGNLRPAAFQIYSYAYEAPLAGSGPDFPPDQRGQTHYLEVRAQRRELSVQVETLGRLLPGGPEEVRLQLKNSGKAAESFRIVLTLSPEAGPARTFWRTTGTLPPSQSQTVSLPYRFTGRGTFQAELRIAPHRSTEAWYIGRTDFSVPTLYAADYGELLPSSSRQVAVWWVEAGHKISRERPAPMRRGRAVQIQAARHEYEPFQIVLRPTRPLKNVTIQIGPLRQVSSLQFPLSNLQFPISVCRVGYVWVEHPTDETGVVADWPDPLPPVEGPLDLPANANAPFWITVYVPPEAAPGDYQGVLTFQAEGWNAKIPLRLHVWGFTLPQETHVQSAFGFSPEWVKRYHNLTTDEEYRQVVDLYLQNFSQHRISPYNPTPFAPIRVDWGPPVTVDFSQFDPAAERAFDQLHFNSFSLPIQGLGGGTFYSREYGRIGEHRQGTPEYERLFHDYITQIQDHLEEKGWLDKAYIYWFDEPDPKDYEFVRETMDLIKRHAPKLTRMLTEQPEPELYGAVDLWCANTPAYRFEIAEQRRAAGERFWWYLCTGPRAPYCTLFIDHPGIELRMWLWQTWKYKVQGILVWHSNYWTSPTAFPDTWQNPWEDPMSYVTGYGTPPGYKGYWGNGDGRFYYPANRDPSDTTTKYLTGPVNSLRWEMLREGIEDYEYFHLLQQAVEKRKAAGDRSAAVREAEALLTVPAEICEDMTHFTTDPALLNAHRAKIAQALERLLAEDR